MKALSPKSVQSAAIERLIRAETFHRFLESIFRGDSVDESPLFSYADFARRAGLSSRSWPREIMLGKRSLSFASLKKFNRAFAFEGTAEKLFTLLAFKKFPALNTEEVSDREIDRQIAGLREKLRKRGPLSKAPVSTKTDLFRMTTWPLVFAALGSADRGASIEEIVARTGVSEAEALKVLKTLVGKEIVNRAGDRYLAASGHLLFSELNREGALLEFYLENLKRAEERARNDFVANDSLHFTSVFSVRAEELPALRQLLLKTAIDFVEKNEEPLGNAIATVVVSLT